MTEKIILAGYLLVGSGYDIRKKAVPLPFLILGGVFVFADIFFRGWESGRMTVLLPGLLLVLLSKATGGIGEADGIVLAYAGLVSREKNIFLIFGISLLYIFFCSMIFFIRNRNHNIQIPYLPFLLASCLTVWIL